MIIGFPKCGTLALRTMLGLHPRVAEANLDKREELHFFGNLDKSYSWYLEQMPRVSKDQLVVEKTASYIDNGKVNSRNLRWTVTGRFCIFSRLPNVSTTWIPRSRS